MADFEPRDKGTDTDQAKARKPTAGPSADDRFGTGFIGSDMRARILAVSVVGGGTRVVMSFGRMHGVHVGMEGYIRGPKGVISELQIDRVEMGRCHAFVEVTPDELSQATSAMLNPTSMPRERLEKKVTARVIGVSVENAMTKIIIARGSANGATAGMTGHLVTPDGREGDEITIASTTARQSIAYIRNTPDYLRQYPEVLLRPMPSKASAPVQRRATGGAAPAADVQSTAQAGVAGASARLPHFDTIQRAFGKHDISGVRAQVGGAAKAASAALGAEAYATGDRVAFASAPDLHTAAHEAAHAVQQRSGVVGFQGLGAADDEHERHADEVADAVVAGRSAEPLLDRLAGSGAGSTQAIQRKGPKVTTGATKAAPKRKPTEVADSVAFAHIMAGDHAVLDFKGTQETADAVYKTVIELARMTTVHQQSAADYEKARTAFDKAREKSTFQMVLGAVTELIEFGVAVYSVVGMAKKTLDAARALRSSYKSYKETKALADELPSWVDWGAVAKQDLGKTAVDAAKKSKQLGEGAKDAYDSGRKVFSRDDKAPDTATVLPDLNAQAIEAGATALRQFAGAQVETELVDVRNKYREGALELSHMVEGVQILTRENKTFSETSLARYANSIEECESAQQAAQASLKKLEAVWKAHAAGGAGALADDRERGLFETIQQWVATGDRRAHSLHVAMDQATKRVVFGGIGGYIEHSPFWAQITRYHAYREQAIQSEQGILYVSDKAVKAQLKSLGEPLKTNDRSRGVAEVAGDLFAGTKFPISISMCKALFSLGLRGAIKDATVELVHGAHQHSISQRHRGEWYEREWMGTTEFGAFWKSALHSETAYVGPEDGKSKPKPIHGATADELARSVRTEPVGLASPRRRD